MRLLIRSALDAYRAVIACYALAGLVLMLGFFALSPAVEAPRIADDQPVPRRLGLSDRSRPMVFRLSALFALDAFAGGLVVQSFMAYWFHVHFNADIQTIGAIFFAANLLAGVSALLAARIAGRFGLINTMVFTHLPSNVML